MKTNNMTLSEKITFYRTLRNMTKSQLAREVSVSPSYITLIENGKNHPSVPLIFKLAQALGITPNELDSSLKGTETSFFIANRTYIEKLKNLYDNLINLEYKNFTINSDDLEERILSTGLNSYKSAFTDEELYDLSISTKLNLELRQSIYLILDIINSDFMNNSFMNDEEFSIDSTDFVQNYINDLLEHEYILDNETKDLLKDKKISIKISLSNISKNTEFLDTKDKSNKQLTQTHLHLEAIIYTALTIIEAIDEIIQEWSENINEKQITFKTSTIKDKVVSSINKQINPKNKLKLQDGKLNNIKNYKLILLTINSRIVYFESIAEFFKKAIDSNEIVIPNKVFNAVVLQQINYIFNLTSMIKSKLEMVSGDDNGNQEE